MRERGELGGKSTERGGTDSLDNHRLHTLLLTSPLHVLRGLDPVEVVDCNVTALLCEGSAEEFAEATARVRVLVITTAVCDLASTRRDVCETGIDCGRDCVEARGSGRTQSRLLSAHCGL